jgi:hypothetical protein
MGNVLQSCLPGPEKDSNPKREPNPDVMQSKTFKQAL